MIEQIIWIAVSIALGEIYLLAKKHLFDSLSRQKNNTNTADPRYLRIKFYWAMFIMVVTEFASLFVASGSLGFSVLRIVFYLSALACWGAFDQMHYQAKQRISDDNAEQTNPDSVK